MPKIWPNWNVLVVSLSYFSEKGKAKNITEKVNKREFRDTLGQFDVVFYLPNKNVENFHKI